jgi:hypothetical protein
METIRYSPIGKEDLNLGTGSFEVTLADGRVVMLSAVDVGKILSTAGLSTQTLSNLTFDSTNIWNGAAIGIAYGGTGSTTALAALQALGASMNKVVAKTANYTVVAADAGVVFNATGTWTLTLTAAATLANGFTFGLVNSGAGTITISPNASEKINASTTMTVPTGTACLVICDGSTWWTTAFWPGYGTSGQSLNSNGSGAAPSFGTSTPILRSYLAGLTLSNDGGSPNTVLDIAAGYAVDSTNAVGITLGAFTKATGGAWAAGTGQNGMGSGLTIANNTWYHVFAIVNAGTADVYFDTSAGAANKPTNTTSFRRIGSFKTAAASTNILAFTQDGDYFRWSASVRDINATNPGTSAVTATLGSVPTGANVQAVFNYSVANDNSAGGNGIYFSDLAANDEAPSASAAPLGQFLVQSGSATMMGWEQIRTNTSAQIRYRLIASDGSTVVSIVTLGWWDYRGRNA